MSKGLTNRTAFNYTMDNWFKEGLEQLSQRKGIPVNEIITETMLKSYPDVFNKAKTSNIRRVIPP